MTIQEILNQFLEVQNNSQLCIVYATKIDSSRDKVSFLTKELIINSSFMNMVIAWEQFLERSVIAYSLSQKSLNGNSPICYIYPKNEEHANDLIRGTTQYFDWSKNDLVQNLTENIFENGSPYKSILSGINSILLQIKKLRNNIAHSSIKSNKEFETLVRSELSPSNVGITTAQFLLTTKTGNLTFWDVYSTHLKNAATQIANF